MIASDDKRHIPFLFLDIETTGLHAGHGARITEIAVLGDRRIRFAATFDADDDRALSRNLPHLLNHLGSGVVVGHNVRFDLRFIAYEMDRLGHAGLNLHFIDTLGLARTLLSSESDHRLETVLRAFGMSPPGELHSALTDARAVRALFWRLIAYGRFVTLADAGLRPLKWTAF